MGMFSFFRPTPAHSESAPPVADIPQNPSGQEARPSRETARREFDRDLFVLEIDAAIESHDEWRDRLKSFLEGRDGESLSPEEAHREDLCGLGRWMTGMASGPQGKSGAFADLQALHSQFHATAARIVSLHLDGEAAAARQLMDGQFRKLNARIGQRLDDMKSV